MSFVENQGTKIYWDDQGQGTPVLLIMGFSYPSDMWYRTRPELSKYYRTIAFDNRGVGRSDVPKGPYPIKLMASDAAAVLDAAEVEKAHIFGISMGGMIAQEFALQYPARVRSLILACTSPGGLHAVQPKANVLLALVKRASMTPEEARKAFIPILYDVATPPGRIEEDMAVVRKWIPAPAAYSAQMQGIMMWSSYRRLPQITAPTLVIHGDSDRLVPPRNGEIIAARIPGAKHVVIPHAGHIIGTDQPEAARFALAEFLGSVDQTQPSGTEPPARI